MEVWATSLPSSRDVNTHVQGAYKLSGHCNWKCDGLSSSLVSCSKLLVRWRTAKLHVSLRKKNGTKSACLLSTQYWLKLRAVPILFFIFFISSSEDPFTCCSFAWPISGSLLLQKVVNRLHHVEMVAFPCPVRTGACTGHSRDVVTLSRGFLFLFWENSTLCRCVWWSGLFLCGEGELIYKHVWLSLLEKADLKEMHLAVAVGRWSF